MTQDHEKIGRRALICKYWKYKNGMLVSKLSEMFERERYISGLRIVSGGERYRIVSIKMEGCLFILSDQGYDNFAVNPEGDIYVPHFDDSATLGCLVDLVKTAWDDPTIGYYCTKDTKGYDLSEIWIVCSMKNGENGKISEGSSPVDALLGALEAAEYQTVENDLTLN